jgi:hypothetical protein
VTLACNKKSVEIFKLSSLIQVIIRGEAYRPRKVLHTVINCKKLGHLWVNCNHPVVSGVEAATFINSASAGK